MALRVGARCWSLKTQEATSGVRRRLAGPSEGQVRSASTPRRCHSYMYSHFQVWMTGLVAASEGVSVRAHGMQLPPHIGQTRRPRRPPRQATPHTNQPNSRPKAPAAPCPALIPGYRTPPHTPTNLEYQGACHGIRRFDGPRQVRGVDGVQQASCGGFGAKVHRQLCRMGWDRTGGGSRR